MHTQELIVKHALGLADRIDRVTKIKNTFEAGKNLKDKVKLLVSKIMNKRSKNLFIKYKNFVNLY